MAFPIEHNTRRFSADEVLRMVSAGILEEGEPLELLDGELIMVPPQGPPHAYVTTQLRDRFLRAYAAGHVVREEKPLVTGRDGLPEPDVAVVRGNPDDYATRHPLGAEALLVVEVAQTSLAIDRAKAAIYARGGVSVYWLVDLVARRLEIYTEPHPDGRYGFVRVLGEDDEATPPGSDATFRISDLLGDTRG